MSVYLGAKTDTTANKFGETRNQFRQHSVVNMLHTLHINYNNAISFIVYLIII